MTAAQGAIHTWNESENTKY